MEPFPDDDDKLTPPTDMDGVIEAALEDDEPPTEDDGIEAESWDEKLDDGEGD